MSSGPKNISQIASPIKYYRMYKSTIAAWEYYFFRFIFIWVGYTHGGFDTVKEERCGGDIGGNLVSDDARGWWVIGGGSRQIRRGAYEIWFYKYDFRQVAASESYIYLQNFDDMYTIYMDRKLLDDLNKNPNRIKTV